MISRGSPTVDAAGAAGAVPHLAGATPDVAKTSERVLLERLKREVMELRYKARRFDEIKDQFPGWRAKAHRYDRLIGELVPIGLRVLARRAQPIIAWALRRKNLRTPTGLPPSAAAPRPLPDPRTPDAGNKGRLCIPSR